MKTVLPSLSQAKEKKHMCASYWTLKAPMICPVCRKPAVWELQTHFMGYPGSCLHVYQLAEVIPELQGVSVRLDGRIADFSGDCPTCAALFVVGAAIVDGKVEQVFVVKQIAPAPSMGQ